MFDSKPGRLGRAARNIAAFSFMIIIGGCSLMYDTSKEQCTTDADCAAHGFDEATCVDAVCQPPAASSEWSCLGSVQWPAQGSGKLSLSLMVIDVMTSEAPQDLDVQLCPKLDPACSTPSPSGAKFTPEGMLQVMVDPGFDGYLQLTAPTITPSLFFPIRPVWEDTVVPGVLPVVSPEGFDGIAQAIGTTRDPELGHTFVMASNCDGHPAPGVRFEVSKLNAKTAGYYMVNNAPVGSENTTDVAGNGGFLNMDPGFATIRGYVSTTGAFIGEASFVVRAGSVTYPRILPTP